MPSDFLTISQAAEILGVDPQTLRRWDESGKLPADIISAGGHRRYRKTTIANLVTANHHLLAKTWVANEIPTIPSSEYHAANSGAFQLKISDLQNELQRIPDLKDIFPLIVAIAGEIGNNSFDHNLGNWPDTAGVFFANNCLRRQLVLADRGQGILTTLRHVRPNLKDDVEALHVAFTEILSGRAPEPRGNGLKFVAAVIKDNPLKLTFQSGLALAHLEGKNPSLDIQIAPPIHGTLALLEY